MSTQVLDPFGGFTEAPAFAQFPYQFLLPSGGFLDERVEVGNDMQTAITGSALTFGLGTPSLTIAVGL